MFHVESELEKRRKIDRQAGRRTEREKVRYLLGRESMINVNTVTTATRYREHK